MKKIYRIYNMTMPQIGGVSNMTNEIQSSSDPRKESHGKRESKKKESNTRKRDKTEREIHENVFSKVIDR